MKERQLQRQGGGQRGGDKGSASEVETAAAAFAAAETRLSGLARARLGLKDAGFPLNQSTRCHSQGVLSSVRRFQPSFPIPISMRNTGRNSACPRPRRPSRRIQASSGTSNSSNYETYELHLLCLGGAMLDVAVNAKPIFSQLTDAGLLHSAPYALGAALCGCASAAPADSDVLSSAAMARGVLS